MQFNEDGTYKDYGFRDGMPFNPMPYKKGGQFDAQYREGQEAVRLLGERYGLGSERANNWLDTGDEEVGWEVDSPYCWYGIGGSSVSDDREGQIRMAYEVRSMTDSLFGGDE